MRLQYMLKTVTFQVVTIAFEIVNEIAPYFLKKKLQHGFIIPIL